VVETITLFVTVLEAGKPEIKLVGDSIPIEGFLPGLQADDFLLHPHKRGKEIISFMSLLLRAVIPFRTYVPKAQPPNAITLGIRN
jgi:hypothetical protein